MDKSILARYPGKFDFNGTPVSITMSDPGLIINPFGNVQWQLYFTSDSDFFVRESMGMAVFLTGRNNKVTGF